MNRETGRPGGLRQCNARRGCANWAGTESNVLPANGALGAGPAGHCHRRGLGASRPDL